MPLRKMTPMSASDPFNYGVVRKDPFNDGVVRKGVRVCVAKAQPEGWKVLEVGSTVLKV